MTLVAEGRARKKRCVMLSFSSNSARTAADPAHNAKLLLWSWLENPLGVVVVVPITVWRDKED